MKLYKSRLPPANIPNDDIYSFLFQKSDPSFAKLPLYIDGLTGRTITHADQKNFAEKMSGAMVNMGVKPGDVVATFSCNHILFPTVLFGSIRMGAVVTTNNHTYTEDELVHQLSMSKSKVLFTHPDVLAVALAACKKVGIPEKAVFLMEKGQNTSFHTVDDLLQQNFPIPPVHKLDKPSSEALSYLVFSSGTTGLAKGVMISHKNVVSNVCQIEKFSQWEASQGVKVLSKGEKTMGILPSYHIYALILLVHYVAKIGACTVWLPKFDLPIFLETIQKYKIGVMYLVPPIVIALAKHPIVDKYDLSSVREIFSGAAPLGGDVAAAVRKRLGNCIVRQGWGLSETSTVVTMAKVDTPDGSIGILIPNAEARLVDPETGKDVAAGEEGEIWVRAPSVTLGYLNNEKATKETFYNREWMVTGDIAVVDKDGQFYIKDRIKEMIKVKGLQVIPSELEALLLTSSLVADVLVVQTPDERAGELPKAFVVLSEEGLAKAKSDGQAVKKQLYDLVAGKLARHKRLDGGIEFVESVPKSPSGKLLRRVLRDQEKAAYAAKQKASKL